MGRKASGTTHRHHFHLELCNQAVHSLSYPISRSPQMLSHSMSNRPARQMERWTQRSVHARRPTDASLPFSLCYRLQFHREKIYSWRKLSSDECIRFMPHEFLKRVFVQDGKFLIRKQWDTIILVMSAQNFWYSLGKDLAI